MKDTDSHDKKICPEHSHEMHDHETLNHSCSYHHVDVEDTSGSRLLMTLALNFIIPVVQIIGVYTRTAWRSFRMPLTISVILRQS